MTDRPGKPLTALMAWKLHIVCATARASGASDRMARALLMVEEDLGAALTHMLSPHVDELAEAAEETEPPK